MGTAKTIIERGTMVINDDGESWLLEHKSKDLHAQDNRVYWSIENLVPLDVAEGKQYKFVVSFEAIELGG